MDKKKKFLVLLIGCMVLISCQQQVVVPVTLQDSQDEMNLRELLVYPEDLGWTNAYYKESKVDYDILVNIPQVDGVSMSSRPFSNSSRYTDRRLVEHRVRIYKNEYDAQETYNDDSSHLLISQAIMPSEKVIDNITAGCRVDPERRDNLRCNVVMQEGRYLVEGFMYIDGDKITLDHWDEFMMIMQERLIWRAAKQSL